MFDHLGIVVSDLDKFVNIVVRLLGAIEVDRKNLEDTRVSILQVGGIKLEIIEPLSEKSRYWFDMRRKKSIHHLSFRVKDKQEILNRVDEIGLKVSSIVESNDYILINLDEDFLDGVVVQFIITNHP
jgi:methylmalonyl-CoA/ethylmalonyl-CoA epimerase